MTSRRGFLAGAASLTGVAAAAAAWPLDVAAAAETFTAGPAGSAAATGGGGATVPGLAGNLFFLTLEGAPSHLSSVEGGFATGEVVNEKLGSDQIVRKHIAAVKYEDITVRMGASGKAIYDWIDANLQHKYSRQNGAIQGANYDHKEVSRLTFYNALVTEIGFPALDAASKDAAKMTIKFSPEYTRFGGESRPVAPSPQPTWTVNNFKMEIEGIDCTRLSKVEAIVVKQKNVEHAIGEFRTTQEIPNVVVLVDPGRTQSWIAWHQDFVVNGNNDRKHTKTGRLTFYSAKQEALFALTLENLGIFKLTTDKVESGSENIRRVKAEMYCENIKFEFKGSWD